MVSVSYSEAVTEVLDILEHSDEDIVNKIPKKLIDFWQCNKSETYKPNLDHSKPINEMNIKDKTRAIITMIYLNYICDEAEKEELLKKLRKNEEALREKYNVDVFKKINDERTQQTAKESIDSVAMVEYKESILTKILSKIKSFWKNLRRK